MLQLWLMLLSDSFLQIDFAVCFQEAEQQSIEMATKLEGVKEEKERLLNSLVEAE